MTRLIDADALKEYIDCGHLRDPGELCFSEIDVVELIDAQPTVDLRKVTQDYASDTTIDTVPKWIPCSERLPEIKEHYVSETCLVCLDNGAIGFSELQENIFGQVGWSCEREDDYHEPLGDVIAWMPLPEPYEVEE